MSLKGINGKSVTKDTFGDCNIMVIGVGGCGGNVVKDMTSRGIKNIHFAIANTDAQALEDIAVENKIRLGSDGLGAGGDPLEGRSLAIESLDSVAEILKAHKIQMLFITAGMGGGTGTGASPVIAKLAKDLGILTIGIVTMPFNYEPSRLSIAKTGAMELYNNVDSLVMVKNDKVIEFYPDLKHSQGKLKGTELLADAVSGIANMLINDYQVNLDFKDVLAVLNKGKVIIMTQVVAVGDNKIDVIKDGLTSSPLLYKENLKGAKSALVLITHDTEENEPTNKEMQIINQMIIDACDNNDGHKVNNITGGGEDLNAKGLNVLLIASGFDLYDLDDFADYKNEANPSQSSVLEQSSLDNVNNSTTSGSVEGTLSKENNVKIGSLKIEDSESNETTVKTRSSKRGEILESLESKFKRNNNFQPVKAPSDIVQLQEVNSALKESFHREIAYHKSSVGFFNGKTYVKADNSTVYDRPD